MAESAGVETETVNDRAKRWDRSWFVTWEISDEDDLSLIVQTALDLQELAPPRREVHQQRHQPWVWLKR